MIKRHSFFQTGLDLVDRPQCPLCDLDWNMDKLRSHLKEKLAKSKDAQVIRDQLIDAGRMISGEIIRLRGLIDPVLKIPEVTKEISTRMAAWSGD
jgi:hypothetical protein